MAARREPRPVDKHVGSRVRMRRLMLGMSQSKLGDALGITFQQLQKCEQGTNRIGASRLQELSAILKVPVSFFFKDAPGSDGKRTKGDQAVSRLSSFLATRDGIALNEAFPKIKDAKLRRRIVELVEQIVAAQ